MKIFSTIQTLFTVILTAVNLVELLATSGQAMTHDEKQAKALEQIRALFKQVAGSDLPGWIPVGLLSFAIDEVVKAFNKTGWFNKGTVDSQTVTPGGLEHAPAQ